MYATIHEINTFEILIMPLLFVLIDEVLDTHMLDDWTHVI